MSYILDALKKADADRERSGVPSLHAHGNAMAVAEAARRSGARWRAVALTSVSVLILAALTWWWATPTPPPPSEPSVGTADTVRLGPPPAAPVAPRDVPVASPVATPPPEPRPATAMPPTVVPPAAPVAALPRTTTPAVTAAPRVAAPTAAAGTKAGSDERLPALAELPADVRRQLPALSVGGSMYSPTPASRMVIVNGQVLREGDRVADGLVVERIGLKSSVLSLNGTRFELKH